jgi:hypothetical protein
MPSANWPMRGMNCQLGAGILAEFGQDVRHVRLSRRHKIRSCVPSSSWLHSTVVRFV